MATTNQRIRYDLEAAVSGEQDVAALARQLEGLADTLEGDLKTQAQASAQALRELGAKQGAIDNFVRLKTEAGAAADRLKQAQTAAQELGRQLSSTTAPTRAQAGQMEKLRDAVRDAKNEVQAQTRALDNSRATLRAYGISSNNVAQAERATRAAVAEARAEVAKLAPAYTAAGNAAAASGAKQVQSAQATRASLTGVGDTLRSIQRIALTAVGGSFLTSLARDAGAVADQYNNLRARISLVTGEGPALEAAFAAVRRVALSTNSTLESTADLFTRVARAGRDVGLSQQQALALTETINQAIQVSGGSAASADAAITQLVQALGSGVLRGDEFNSIMEQAPRLAQALAAGLSVTTGELRALSQQGRLTSEVVLTALQGQAQAVAAEFERLPLTIGRALTNLGTQWTDYIGKVDAATGASSKAAEAIQSIGNNLDSIVGAAIRAGAALQTAWAVMTTGANGVLSVVFKVGELFASVAGGIQRSVADIAGALARITFGGLSEGFAKAAADIQLSADATFAAADALNARAREAFLSMADGAQAARDGWAELTGEVAAGGKAVADASAQAAQGLADVGAAAEAASRKVTLSARDIAEAYEAAALAKAGDARAAEANLRVQLQLARQSEDMARFLGDENGVRAAKIEQMQIEIRLVQARAEVARVEAEGSIAVAEAKLAEMRASGEVNLVKQAEIEASIKLAQAKIAEANATAQSTDLMQRQLDAFRRAVAGGEDLGQTLGRLADRQGRFAERTREANAEIAEQIGWLDRLKARNDAVQSTVRNRETPATAFGESRDSIEQKLLAAGVDETAARAQARYLFQIYESEIKSAQGARGSTAGIIGDQSGLEVSRFTAALQQATAQGTGVGRTVTVNLKNGSQTDAVETDEKGAAAIVRAFKTAARAAGR